MNYCRRCESDYEKPGTCNCFAEGSDATPAEVKPWTPPFGAGTIVYPVVPYPVYPYWGSGWWGIYPPTGYVAPDTGSVVIGNNDGEWSTSWIHMSGQGTYTSDNASLNRSGAHNMRVQ
jgi:hypothetical protein